MHDMRVPKRSAHRMIFRVINPPGAAGNPTCRRANQSPWLQKMAVKATAQHVISKHSRALRMTWSCTGNYFRISILGFNNDHPWARDRVIHSSFTGSARSFELSLCAVSARVRGSRVGPAVERFLLLASKVPAAPLSRASWKARPSRSGLAARGSSGSGSRNATLAGQRRLVGQRLSETMHGWVNPER
jgi:hypothetical protein